MSITLLRWKSGAAGDTLLKMLLLSNNVQSQMRYVSGPPDRTHLDVEAIKSFRYDQISMMALHNSINVAQDKLLAQLRGLEQEAPLQPWLLKTHCYFEFPYRVIDIKVGVDLVPFTVKASLIKNSRSKNLIPDYHPDAKNMSDPETLYRFDCHNYTYDLLYNQPEKHSDVFDLSTMLGTWDGIVDSVNALGYTISDDCQDAWAAWKAANSHLMPSARFQKLLADSQFDYDNKELTLEERYCFLVMSGQPFRVLS